MSISKFIIVILSIVALSECQPELPQRKVVDDNPVDVEIRKVVPDKHSDNQVIPFDEHEFCCFWAANNECFSNYRYMRTRCQKSCGTTGCTLPDAQDCRVTVNAVGCRYPPASPKIWDAGDKVSNLGALYRLLMQRVGVRV